MRPLQQQEHELRELESLVEAKIYREDELERQIELLKREAERPGTALSHTSSTHRNDPYAANGTNSRAPSAASNHTSGSATACPLCHGDHDMAACPMFTNEEADESPDKRSPSLSRGDKMARRKSGLSMEQVWCDNCDVSSKSQLVDVALTVYVRRPRIIARRIVRWRMMSFRQGITRHSKMLLKTERISSIRRAYLPDICVDQPRARGDIISWFLSSIYDFLCIGRFTSCLTICAEDCIRMKRIDDSMKHRRDLACLLH